MKKPNHPISEPYTFGNKHWDQTTLIVAYALNGLGNLYSEQSLYEEAEPFYKRALQIREQALGSEHAEVAESLTELAAILSERGKY